MLVMDRYMYFGGIGNLLVFSEKPHNYMKSFEKELLGFRQGGNYQGLAFKVEMNLIT